MTNKEFTNKLILGDNLEIMRTLETESVDLIYLDPPFFSNRNYEVVWGDDGEVRSFQDRWAGGMEHYIAWLKERVIEMHRILKPTGSIFLHCDWHANANIRVDILDKIFLSQNFRNEIIWHYRRWTGKSNNFQRLHDTIFFYSKTSDYKFNVLYTDYTEGSIDRKQGGVLHRFKKGEEPLLVSDKEIDEKGVCENDVWQIPFVAPSAKERIGYPTQKPETLLQRIIECASNEGDIVLDPFVGGGTTIAVADKLKRKWIGIDQSVAAIKVSDLRLKNQQDLYSEPYDLQLRIYNYNDLRNMDAFIFETMIIEKFGGIANAKQRNDLGLDGTDKIKLQVEEPATKTIE
ncbi:MAG: site-specific DNA-methyltransferase [Bacteroidetes bacterium]|nr:site-specific DNA-methyltransferase [Bacteroidota bacterium]